MNLGRQAVKAQAHVHRCPPVPPQAKADCPDSATWSFQHPNQTVQPPLIHRSRQPQAAPRQQLDLYH